MKPTRSTKYGATRVLGTVCLDNDNNDNKIADRRQYRVKDIASLSEHLPQICTHIFEQVGSQQLEATYQRCLRIDLEQAGVQKVELEPELHLTYKGQVVGTRRADIHLELDSGETAIIELKAVNEMQMAHRKQLEYYLHHSNVNKGYLINFPHDSSFPDVNDESSFTTRLLYGMLKKVEHLLTGGTSMRLRNTPHTRQVEVLEVTRKALNKEEMAQAKLLAPPRQRFGIKANGEECTICIRECRFCRFHVSQKL